MTRSGLRLVITEVVGSGGVVWARRANGDSAMYETSTLYVDDAAPAARGALSADAADNGNPDVWGWA